MRGWDRRERKKKWRTGKRWNEEGNESEKKKYLNKKKIGKEGVGNIFLETSVMNDS